MKNFGLVKILGSSVMATAIFLYATLPSLALSAPNFRVWNDGSTRAIELDVSPSQSDDWGDNLLDPYGDELDPDHFVYALRNYDLGSCVQDMRVIYEDGHRDFLYGTNICRNDIHLHY